MADLTAIVLTKNEENNIEKCIRTAAKCVKRFVIVDSFSDDKTEEIVNSLKAEYAPEVVIDFYQNKWVNYATQFNWGIDNTNISTKWIIRYDADEELTEELVEEINNKLDSLSDDISGVNLYRRVMFMGKWMKHGGMYLNLLRIFRTGKGRCENRQMDEHMILDDGQIVDFKYDFIDNNNKHLDWWTNKHNWYSNREVKDHLETLKGINEGHLDNTSEQAAFKRKIKDNVYYKLPKFFRARLFFIYRYYFRLGFLDGTEGKIFTFLQAYWYRFLVDAKMYECEKEGFEPGDQGDLK